MLILEKETSGSPEKSFLAEVKTGASAKGCRVCDTNSSVELAGTSDIDLDQNRTKH
jgi:hypothetical protein